MTNRHGTPEAYRQALADFATHMRKAAVMANIADKRKSASVYDRAEYWLVHFSWLYPDDFEELQKLANDIEKEGERVSRAAVFEGKE